MEPWYEAMVGCLGKVWRTNRRRLKPHVKDAFAALLLEIRLEYLPEVYLDSASNIGRSRCDIRGVTELLRHVAARPAAPIVASAATPLPNSSCGDPWHCIGGPDPWSSVGSSLRAIAAVFVPAVDSYNGAEFDDLEECSKGKDKNKSECDTKVKEPHFVPAVWEPVSVVAPNLLDLVNVPSGDARVALGYNITAGVDISSMASSAVVLPASSRCSDEGSWPVEKEKTTAAEEKRSFAKEKNTIDKEKCSVDKGKSTVAEEMRTVAEQKSAGGIAAAACSNAPARKPKDAFGMFVDSKRSEFPACSPNERNRFMKTYRTMWDNASPHEVSIFEDRAEDALSEYKKAVNDLNKPE